MAILTRAVALLIPLVGAFVVLQALGPTLYHAGGVVGFIVWFVQAAIIGTVTSVVLDRLSRRLLPLATLLNMSIVFPDQAPSRFGVALRSGPVKQLKARLVEQGDAALGDSENEAAVNALEFISALSRHDRLTRGHTERVRAYAELIAIELGLSAEERSRLAWGVMLHDVGKMTVPSEVLNKVDALTDQEWEMLKGHPAAGQRLLRPLERWLGEWAYAAGQHHERWDGNGYPAGLAGEEISLAGRITAVADAYDVITSKRSYKAPMSVEAARRELVSCAGAQFDPTVVRAFLNVSLGRRWTVGPLAVFSHLPIGNLTTAPAIVSVGTALSVGAVALAPQTQTVESLAFTEPPPIVTEVEVPPSLIDPIGRPTSVTTAEPSTVPSTDGTDVETSIDNVSTTTVQTTTAVSVTALTTTVVSITAQPTTVSTATPPTTTTQTTTATTAPTTTALPTTTTTTAPTTTTTTAPTTTTTTTTAPTTTTTTIAPPVGAFYHLKNPGLPGDSTAQTFKKLETNGPDDTSLPNFDTDRDSIPGLRLESTGSGFAESSLVKIQRYNMAPTSALNGPATLRLWVATDSDLAGAPVTIRADVADCDGLYWSCTSLSEDTAVVTSWVNDGFQRLDFDFGSLTRTFGFGRFLAIRLITEDGHTVHVGFDADDAPSLADLSFD